MSPFRQVLISLLYVAVFFLIILITTTILFSTAWSTSGKCSTSCQRIINSWKQGADNHPDESWAEIPEELYSFFTPPPRFPSKEAMKHKCETNSVIPPIGIVFSVENSKHENLGIAAVLLRRWVLMRNYLIQKSSNKTHKYVRFNSNYLSKGGEVIRVTRIVYYKLLASLYLEHPINSDCIQFAMLLTDPPAGTYTGYTVPFKSDDAELEKLSYTRENATGKSTCAPLFTVPNETFVLSGFMKCHNDEPVKDLLIFQKGNESYYEWIENL